MDINEQAIALHKKLKGKIATALRGEVTKDTLKLFYSPGVGAASLYAQNDSEKLKEVSWTNNLIAVISDGSAVLGLGDIGPEGAMPVMEGKSMLFKHFANIDSVPIVLNVHTVDEIVATVKAIAPSFGGINLEDIAAPKCFEIEERLKRELTIPVMHDDQHGTAIVVLAGLINAAKVTGRNLSETKVVLVGAGAAGVAVAKLLYSYARPSITVVDSKGILAPSRKDLTEEKVLLMSYSDKQERGSLQDALKDADIFIGLSKGGLLTAEMVQQMAPHPIVFALANPTPEILPEEAAKAGVAVIATGRSDYPNQVNNALGFPGIFRGALDNNVQKITDEHKIAAAEALAGLVPSPTAEKIIPSPFDPGVVEAVANTIR